MTPDGLPQPPNDMQAVIDTAQAAVTPHVLTPDEPVAIVVPLGAQLVAPDLTAWRSRPSRKTGTFHPATVESFIAFVKDQLEDETTIWVHPTSGRVVAVINGNDSSSGTDEPGWGDHRAALDLAKTPEWNYWIDKDGVAMSQADFAEHIEGGLEEIVEPDAADVLELAQSFHATSSATFRQSTRLHSGEQRLQYDEAIDAKAGASGDMTVPTAFLLGIAPFIGEDRYKLAARFRFRLQSGKLSLTYKLDRPDAVVREAVEKIAERLGNEFGKVYVGEPN